MAPTPTPPGEANWGKEHTTRVAATEETEENLEVVPPSQATQQQQQQQQQQMPHAQAARNRYVSRHFVLLTV